MITCVLACHSTVIYIHNTGFVKDIKQKQEKTVSHDESCKDHIGISRLLHGACVAQWIGGMVSVVAKAVQITVGAKNYYN